MTKRTSLEEVFNLPPARIEEIEEGMDEIQDYTTEQMNDIMDRADKIDAALPQVKGLDAIDSDYDIYAKKSLTAFEDLVDLGMNVEDRNASEIFQAASSMMSNAITAKTNKAQKKIEMVKLQLQNAKLEHEREKLEYLKERHLRKEDPDTPETEGKIIGTRSDLIAEILASQQNNETDGKA